MDHPLIRIAVLGSTGSIGCQTLEVVRARPDLFRIVALAAGRNTDLLARQIEAYARAAGLDMFDCYYEMLDFDEINMVASYMGFPVLWASR